MVSLRALVGFFAVAVCLGAGLGFAAGYMHARAVERMTAARVLEARERELDAYLQRVQECVK